MSIEINFDSDKQYIQVKGILTSTTVMDALAQFARECEALPSWVIDFTKVSKVDSAAIALLIELKRNARKKQKTVKFIYLPAALLKIASLSEVEDLLTENTAS
ncbi:MAG: STAS domain-containing protein [Gammaproteobacteria bacterium]|nr:STAS domain-containing protein [Gammaproteobacteria bacterium]